MSSTYTSCFPLDLTKREKMLFIFVYNKPDLLRLGISFSPVEEIPLISIFHPCTDVKEIIDLSFTWVFTSLFDWCTVSLLILTD